MGVPTRITTWSADESVSNSDLNAEFNIAINALADGTKDANVASITINGTLTSTGNVTSANVTSNSVVTANTVVVTNPDRIGDIYNLGITLSSGLLSITDRTGAALSSTNFGTVTMPSVTAGLHQNIKLSAPITLRDEANATNDFDGVGFGITEAVDWAQDMPLFLYVVNKGGNAVADADGNSAICIARNPAMAVTPASGLIGKKGSVPGTTDSQTSVVLLGSTYTVANYAALPTQLIGVVRARWGQAATGWTIQTLGQNDGIGPEALRKTWGTLWTMPVNQNGAAASAWLLANGGTAPIFTTNNYVYKIEPTGFITCYVYLVGDGGTDGAGSVNSQLVVPANATATIATSTVVSTGWLRVAGTADYPMFVDISLSNSFVTLDRFTTSAGSLQGTLNNVQNADFANGDRRLSTTFTYKAF